MKSYFKYMIILLLFRYTSSFAQEVILQETKLGTINQVIRDAIDRSLYPFYGEDNSDCKNAGTNQDTRKPTKQYHCGEVPYGDILRNGKKLIFDFSIPRGKKKSGGVKIRTSKVRFPIYMSRKQSRGEITLPWFQDQAITTITTSPRLGESIYTRYSPANTSLFNSICLSIPGIHIYSPKRKFAVRGVKKIFWFIKAKVKATTKLKLIDYRFNNINSCATFKFNFPEESLVEGPSSIKTV